MGLLGFEPRPDGPKPTVLSVTLQAPIMIRNPVYKTFLLRKNGAVWAPKKKSFLKNNYPSRSSKGFKVCFETTSM